MDVGTLPFGVKSQSRRAQKFYARAAAAARAAPVVADMESLRIFSPDLPLDVWVEILNASGSSRWVYLIYTVRS